MHPFTRKLRELVIAGNVNQRDLCRKAQIAPATLQDCLNHGRLPRVDVLRRLAKALGVLAEELACPDRPALVELYCAGDAAAEKLLEPVPYAELAERNAGIGQLVALRHGPCRVTVFLGRDNPAVLSGVECPRCGAVLKDDTRGFLIPGSDDQTGGALPPAKHHTGERS